MPIWIRKFTFNKMKEFYNKEQEATDEQNGILTNKNVSEIARPNIPQTSTYNTSVSNKN